MEFSQLALCCAIITSSVGSLTYLFMESIVAEVVVVVSFFFQFDTEVVIYLIDLQRMNVKINSKFK